MLILIFYVDLDFLYKEVMLFCNLISNYKAIL